jgi:folate-binding protein YgfZ
MSMAGDGAREQYAAARQGAVLADRAALGRLWIGGPDALDLLHRLTTQSIKDLRPGDGTAAVFTTPKGRILDLVVLHLREDGTWCLTGEGRAETVRAWIDRYTFREEVRVEDRSAATGTLGLYGPAAPRVVARVFGADPGGAPHRPLEVEAGGARGLLARWFPLAGAAYHLTADAASLARLRGAIETCGEGVEAIGAEVLEVLRIEAGLPAAGRELTEEYNPWEARLDQAVSLNKGCYVGQEVIARLHTYRKVSKGLVRLAIEAAAPPPTPCALRIAGDPAGTLTSAAAVPGEGRVAGLGYVRLEDAVAGREAEAVWEGGRARAAIGEAAP